MYLKTPKRYSDKRRKPRLFSLSRILFWMIVPALIYGGWRVYQARETLVPVVSEVVENAVNDGMTMVSTVTAPTPMPTENPMNIINRADAGWFAGRVEEALAEYQTILINVPNDVQSHYNYTLGLIVEGRYTEAVEAAERTITADPFAVEGWAVRAFALLRDGDTGRALASARYAQELNPNSALPYAILTEIYLDLEQPERAREAVERAVELDPNLPHAYYARGLVSQLVDYDREAAREDFSAAYEIAPYLTDAAVDFAYNEYALYINGTAPNLDEALNTLRSVTDDNPNNANALYALGFMYYAGLGDPNQAADYLARCTRVDGDNADCLYYYGRVLIAQERYQEAADNLSRAVEVSTANDDPNPRYNYWAGEAQIYLGNCPLALTYLRPGYDVALEQESTQLASDLQTSIRECSTFGGADPFAETATPIPDDETAPTEESGAPTPAPNA